jgi:Na+-transporting NADH:ubiquinone oxidoreductase subunit NqrD
MRLKPGRRISGLYIFQAEEAVKAKYVEVPIIIIPPSGFFFISFYNWFLVTWRITHHKVFFDPPQKNQRLG